MKQFSDTTKVAVAILAPILWCTSSFADSCPDLTGTYICDKSCPTEGMSSYEVVQEGQDLQVSDGKSVFKAYVVGAKTIIAAWIWRENPLKGTLNADCSEIVWANGSVWTRARTH